MNKKILQKTDREKEVDSEMEKVPENFRKRWCQAKTCFCMGCANRVGRANITKEEHEAWLKRQLIQQS